MAVPEEIRRMRPTGLGKATEVRLIGGHYYVYEISSRWDENRRRPQKTTGRCIGKIVPGEGFIANQYYIDTYHQPGTESHVRHYGAVETLRQLGGSEVFVSRHLAADRGLCPSAPRVLQHGQDDEVRL